jgi:hypothetical protein
MSYQTLESMPDDTVLDRPSREKREGVALSPLVGARFGEQEPIAARQGCVIAVSHAIHAHYPRRLTRHEG